MSSALASNECPQLQRTTPSSVDELEALRKQNAAQREQIAQFVEQLARLNERVAELLAVAQRKQRKPRAAVETPPPVAPPVIDDEQRPAFENRPKPPEKPKTERSEKRSVKPRARARWRSANATLLCYALLDIRRV